MTRQSKDLTPLRVHNGGFSTDATDPEMVKALARRVIRPLRERARVLGYAIAVHGSLERDIDLVAVPWTDQARSPENLATSLRQVLSKLYPIGLEVPPSDEPAKRKPHGRQCWSWWIRPWTYIDLSVFPPTLCPGPRVGPHPVEAAVRAACKAMGADPETWRGFEEIGRIAADAFVAALPAELAAQVRLHHQPETTKC